MERVVKKGIKSNFLSPLLSASGMATVHSIFENSLNVMYRKQLIHIGKPEEGVSAFGLTMDDKDVTELLENVHKEARIRIRNGEIIVYTRLGTWIIQHDAFEEYDCRIPVLKEWTTVDTQKTLQVLEEQGTLTKNGLQVDQVALDWIQAFVHRNLNEQSFQEHFMKQLIGRGIGLTPSGDDFLMGIMLGIWSHPPFSSWTKQLKDVLEVRRTTAVSESYYQAMLQGFTSSAFVEWNLCLQQRDFEQLPKVIANISEYGHTSGWDTLYGLYMFYKNKQESEGE